MNHSTESADDSADDSADEPAAVSDAAARRASKARRAFLRARIGMYHSQAPVNHNPASAIPAGKKT